MPPFGDPIRGSGPFVAYRCDRSGLAGQTIRRTSFVREHALFQELTRDWTRVLPLLRGESRWDRYDVGKMAAEIIFERVRREVDSSAPSRLDCVFLFPLELTAAIFRRDWQPQTVVYRCMASGSWALAEFNAFNGVPISMAALDPESIAAAVAGVRANAVAYWSGKFTLPTIPEVLLAGDATFVEELGAVDVPAHIPRPRFVDDNADNAPSE